MSQPVLHIITGLSTGGAEMMLLKLSAAMAGGPYPPVVLSLRDEGTIGARLQALGIPVHTLGLVGPSTVPGALLGLRRIARSVRPALIQGWMYHGNIAALLAAGMAPGRPVVLWNVRHTPDMLAAEKGTIRLLIRAGALLSRRPDRIIYNAQAAARRHEALGFVARRSVVIPNGFETARFAPDPAARPRLLARLDLPPTAVLVGHFARFHPMKNHTGLLDAAALTVRQRPTVHFLLAGREVDDQNVALLRQRERLGLQRVVHFLGEVADPAAVVAGLDIACLASTSGEAFPNVLGEALSAGIPCVTTDLGDARWIVGEAGEIVVPGDPAALAAGIVRLVDAGEVERRRLGELGRHRVHRDFSLPAIAEAYRMLFNECLDRR